MGRSQETFNKKENEKKRVKKKQDKLLKKQDRKSNSVSGKGIEEMFAYVDANGQLSDTPPDPKVMKKLIKLEDIQISISKQEDMEPVDVQRSGKVTFFNESKGYGFIKDSISGDSIFVHINNLEEAVSENDNVTFETEMGKKGMNAIKVKIKVAEPKAPKAAKVAPVEEEITEEGNAEEGNIEEDEIKEDNEDDEATDSEENSDETAE